MEKRLRVVSGKSQFQYFLHVKDLRFCNPNNYFLQQVHTLTDSLKQGRIQKLKNENKFISIASTLQSKVTVDMLLAKNTVFGIFFYNAIIPL